MTGTCVPPIWRERANLFLVSSLLRPSVWAKIERVLHEFSHLPGVTEDTLDIMMNLRKVVFVLHVNRPKTLRLKAQGPQENAPI